MNTKKQQRSEAVTNQILYVVKHIKPLKLGKSHPQIFLMSDGREYVVKFKKDFDGTNRHTTRSLVNEWLACKLGTLLSLPVVPFITVYIPQSFIDENKDLSKRGFLPGNQFASLFIRNCASLIKGISPPGKSMIRNREAIAGIIVFDHWLGNADRGRGNILLEPLRDGKYNFHIIDHGDCFPGKFQWTKETLQEKPNPLSHKAVYRWCVSLLKHRDELHTFVKKVKTLSDETIFQIIEGIPDDWGVLTEEKGSLFDYLVNGKDALPDLIADFVDQYSKYNHKFKKMGG